MKAAARYVTTSWDDGHPTDFKLADLLVKYGMKGTFYIPRWNAERKVITESEILELSQGFEIGGHTMTHVLLDRVGPETAANEIRGCYSWLGELLGRRIDSFCYPGGHVTKVAVRLAQESGFRFARTTHLLQTDLLDKMMAPTSLQMYPHARETYAKNLAKRMDIKGIARYILSLHMQTDLLKLTDLLLDGICRKGGVFHLWGHSWEIEEKGLWAQTEEAFKILAAMGDVRILTNGELAATLQDDEVNSANKAKGRR